MVDGIFFVCWCQLLADLQKILVWPSLVGTNSIRAVPCPTKLTLVQDNLIAFLSSVLLHPKSLTTMEIDPSLQGETPLHDEEVNVKKVQEGKRLSILDCAFSLIVLDCLSYKNFRVRLSILLI